jgi:hypothetical protein
MPRTRHLGESVGAWPRLNRSSKGVAMGVASREATSATRKKVQLAAKSSDAVTILPALADAMHVPGSADRSAGSRGARITNSEPDAYKFNAARCRRWRRGFRGIMASRQRSFKSCHPIPWRPVRLSSTVEVITKTRC